MIAPGVDVGVPPLWTKTMSPVRWAVLAEARVLKGVFDRPSPTTAAPFTYQTRFAWPIVIVAVALAGVPVLAGVARGGVRAEVVPRQPGRRRVDEAARRVDRHRPAEADAGRDDAGDRDAARRRVVRDRRRAARDGRRRRSAGDARDVELRVADPGVGVGAEVRANGQRVGLRGRNAAGGARRGHRERVGPGRVRGPGKDAAHEGQTRRRGRRGDGVGEGARPARGGKRLAEAGRVVRGGRERPGGRREGRDRVDRDVPVAVCRAARRGRDRDRQLHGARRQRVERDRGRAGSRRDRPVRDSPGVRGAQPGVRDACRVPRRARADRRGRGDGRHGQR